MIKPIWQFLASVRLSIYLLFLVSCNLAIGACYLKWMPDVFRPLNRMLIQDWFSNYSTGHSWWVVSLLLLLFLLGVNTGVCTLDRLAALLPRRREFPFGRFFLKLSPSLMHIFFFIALSGHALSIFMGEHKKCTITAGDEFVLFPFTVLVKNIDFAYWDSPYLEYPLRQCTVALAVTSPINTATKEISILRPLWIQGWSLHLDVNPKVKPGETAHVNLIMKKDPGTDLILLGGALLSLLMGWYFIDLTRNRKGKRP